MHQFAEGQPDLNYRDANLVSEMQDVLRYWLAKGVAGFRVDAVWCLLEAEDFRDELLTGTTDPLDPAYTYKHYTQDLVSVFVFVILSYLFCTKYLYLIH